MPVTNYIWDEVNDTLLMEKDEAGNTTAAYTYEPGQYGPLISQRRGGQTSHYHSDGQGSTRQLTDAAGNVTDTSTYAAFGEPVASTGTTTNPFGYKGALGYYANPDTDDVNVRARIYDPSPGRWISIDPLYYSVATTVAERYTENLRPSSAELLRLQPSREGPPQFPLLASPSRRLLLPREENSFSYVHNAPTVHNDPSGLTNECRLGIFDEDDAGIVGANGRNFKCSAEAAYGSNNIVPMGSSSIGAAVNEAKSRGCCIRKLGVFDHGSIFDQQFNDKMGLTAAEVASLCAQLCHGAVIELWGCHQMASVAPATTNATITALFACNKISTVSGCTGCGRHVPVDSKGGCCWHWRFPPYCDGRYASVVNPIYVPPPLPWPVGIPPNCFVEGTLVAVPNGLVPIERLTAGDPVLAFDFEAGSVVHDRIIRSHCAEVSTLLELAMDGESLRLTSDHPVYEQSRGWTCALDLARGDHLLSREGVNVEIIGVRQVDQKALVFNVSGREQQNYFVGSRAILVHNK